MSKTPHLLFIIIITLFISIRHTENTNIKLYEEAKCLSLLGVITPDSVYIRQNWKTCNLRN